MLVHIPQLDVPFPLPRRRLKTHGTRFEQLPVQVDDVSTPRPLVQVVNVLGDHGYVIVVF